MRARYRRLANRWVDPEIYDDPGSAAHEAAPGAGFPSRMLPGLLVVRPHEQPEPTAIAGPSQVRASCAAESLTPAGDEQYRDIVGAREAEERSRLRDGWERAGCSARRGATVELLALEAV